MPTQKAEQFQAINTDGSLDGIAVKQKASGVGSALRVDSDSTASPAVVVQGSGDLLDLRDSTGASQFLVSNTGALTVNGAQTVTGDYTITGALAASGNISVTTAGNGLRIAEGANAKMGVSSAMVAGTVTISTTAVTANSRIFLTPQTLGTIARPAAVGVTARTAATSFVITSSDATDTSTVAWMIVEPA